ncbi:hypothetical protein CI102_3367 [Trichoderma harzianum]|nr:hypothetical protein CI102_3367 [Trichoderma harzianum]
MSHSQIQTENRELPLNQPENWQVKFPRYMVELPEHVHDVNVSYIGIQPRYEEKPARGLHTELNAHVTSAAQRTAVAKVEEWIRQGAGELSPVLWEKIYVEAGCDVPDTEIYILYWIDKDVAKAANKSLNLQLLHKTLSSSDQKVVGLWRESFTVPKQRFETVYSGNDYQPGIASLEGAQQVGHKFTGYWGAARDRFPASSHDPFEPEYKLSPPNFEKDSKGRVIEGENRVSVLHIRSGQYWERCKDDEIEAYESTLEPVLRAGMTYLEENPAESGDIGLRFSRNMTTNRLLQAEEAQQLASLNGFGSTVRRRRETCSSGFFRSLKDIEAWASKHKSHHKIFHGAHSHSQQFGKETFKMRTWHEVSALKPGEVTFEYINCYPRTGLIPFFDV